MKNKCHIPSLSTTPLFSLMLDTYSCYLMNQFTTLLSVDPSNTCIILEGNMLYSLLCPYLLSGTYNITDYIFTTRHCSRYFPSLGSFNGYYTPTLQVKRQVFRDPGFWRREGRTSGAGQTDVPSVWRSQKGHDGWGSRKGF